MSDEKKSVYERFCDLAAQGDTLCQKIISDVVEDSEHFLDFTPEKMEKNHLYNEVIYLLECAYQGDYEKQYYLGLACHKGVIFYERSPSEALKWLTLAAEGGYVPAQAKLGEIYCFGDVDEQEDIYQPFNLDWKQGIFWLQKAAEQGEMISIHSLGVIENDTQKIKLAANAGLTDAQCNLARRLEEEGNYTEAFEWYEKAAVQKKTGGYDGLLGLYYSNKGVEFDVNKTHDLFIKEIETYEREF